MFLEASIIYEVLLDSSLGSNLEVGRRDCYYYASCTVRKGVQGSYLPIHMMDWWWARATHRYGPPGAYHWAVGSSFSLSPQERQTSFDCTSLYCPPYYVFFYKLKVWGNPTSSKSIGAIFPTDTAHFVSLSHSGNSCNTANFFTIITFVMVIFDVTTMTHWRLRWWLEFFSRELYFN